MERINNVDLPVSVQRKQKRGKKKAISSSRCMSNQLVLGLEDPKSIDYLAWLDKKKLTHLLVS